MCRAYAVDRRLWPVAKRVTFLIDPEGMVIGRFSHELRISAHVTDVLGALRQAQRGGPQGRARVTSRTGNARSMRESLDRFQDHDRVADRGRCRPGLKYEWR